MSDPQKFQGLGVVVEAMRFDDLIQGLDVTGWVNSHMGAANIEMGLGSSKPPVMFIETPEGRLKADLGDWIVRVPGTVFYQYTPELFAETFKEISP